MVKWTFILQEKETQEMIIYKVINSTNKKVYIGQTVQSFAKRKYAHICKSKNGGDFYFAHALSKYGTDNFKWEVICFCPNIDSLNEQEQYYIALYDSMNKGYNLTNGGENYIVSDETKQKVSEATKGKNNPNYGKKHSFEARAKMSIMKSGKNNPNYGKKHSPETLKKMSIVKLGKNHPMYGVHRFGKDAPMYGKHHSKEAKEKIRQAVLKRWAKL